MFSNDDIIRMAGGVTYERGRQLYDAGYVLDMDVPLASAVRAASENPARSIGVESDYGSLAPGRYGNVILADHQLNIQKVIQKGHIIAG